MNRYRTLVVVAACAVVAGTLYWVPVEVPHRISLTGRLRPVQEWMLVRDADGNVEGQLRNHAWGRTDVFTANRFVRGEAVRLTLHPERLPATAVAVGDTVASIYSSAIAAEEVLHYGSLATALATLDLFAAGEKEAVVREAEEMLAGAEAQRRQQENEVQRLQILHERALISEQMLEQAQSLLQVLEAGVEAARARLDVVRTGARAQELDVARTEVAALRDGLDLLRQRMAFLTITSPIAGRVTRSYGSDTLLVVQDTSAFTLTMPVRWEEQRRLVPGHRVAVQVPGLDEPLRGRLLQTGDEIRVVGGDQVLLATALIEDVPPGLVPGALVPCTITLDTVPLWTYLKTRTLEAFGWTRL